MQWTVVGALAMDSNTISRSCANSNTVVNKNVHSLGFAFGLYCVEFEPLPAGVALVAAFAWTVVSQFSRLGTWRPTFLCVCVCSANVLFFGVCLCCVSVLFHEFVCLGGGWLGVVSPLYIASIS